MALRRSKAPIVDDSIPLFTGAPKQGKKIITLDNVTIKFAVDLEIITCVWCDEHIVQSFPPPKWLHEITSNKTCAFPAEARDAMPMFVIEEWL